MEAVALDERVERGAISGIGLTPAGRQLNRKVCHGRHDANGPFEILPIGRAQIALPQNPSDVPVAADHRGGADRAGGSGRSPSTGETFYYQLDVPAGRPELNANVTLAENPNNPFTMFLVDPSGNVVGQGANELPSSTPPGFTNELGAQAHALSPAPGRWTLIVAFVPQVAGTAITEPFAVRTSDTRVPASSSGVPNSNRTRLARGRARTYQVHIRNTSSAPAAYFVDPRLPGTTTLRLVSLNGPTVQAPLTGSSQLPLFLVPTHTSKVSATAQAAASTPIQLDTQAPAGDPDIGSNVGRSVIARYSAHPVAPGAWDIAPDVAGGFGANGVDNESVTTGMTATANAFDRSVSSSTGDMWQVTVNPGLATGLSPVIIRPGQTGTITVTLIPRGARGSRHRGTLYIDSEDLFQFQVNTNVVNDNTGNPEPNGSEVAAIPYRYTVR